MSYPHRDLLDQLEMLDHEEVLVDPDLMGPKEDKDLRDCLDKLVTLGQLEIQVFL